MSRRGNKMIVTLAGPGAGKTTDLIRQIMEDISKVDNNRELVIITYTNASVEDIKNKLLKYISIPQNVFIGTIHSFLFRYFIQNYANEFGYLTSGTLIVEAFNEEGIDWIDEWVSKKFPSKDEQRNRARAMKLKQRNLMLEAAAKKGIYTFDGIVKISKTISGNSEVIKSISNRIQFLYVDEYQDINKYGHDIIKLIWKQKKTQISIVGDPDQSIYRFRYGQSQFGEKAPKGNKIPLREYMEMEDKDINIRTLTINHRSSKEIVEFNNRYGTIDNQVPQRENGLKVQFIRAANSEEIYTRFQDLCNINHCKQQMLLAMKQKTVDRLRLMDDLESKMDVDKIDLKTICDYFIASSGLTYQQFCKKYDLDKFQIRRIGVSVRNALSNNLINENQILCYMKEAVEALYDKKVILKNSVTTENGTDLQYNFMTNIEVKKEGEKKAEIRRMTIHKSKGLEAEAVLVVAETKNELLKWVNMSKSNMKSETDEDYRLGYVAFTRARDLLVLACLEEVDIKQIKNTVKLELIK